MGQRQLPGYTGTGPGAITPDGCAVQLWARLPIGTEIDVIAAAAPPGADLLELGCGAGRMTHPLIERGFTLTAVDESADMLAHLHGATIVHDTIENLDLGRTFDVVLLASFLVHVPDPAVRRALLDTCRRHVNEHGSVLLQRQRHDHHEQVPRSWRSGEGLVHVLSSEEVSPGVRSVHTRIEYPDATWTQTYLSRPLDQEQFEAALGESGLRVQDYLSSDQMWVRAVPVA